MVSSSPDPAALRNAARTLQQARKIVVFTGAGVSAESGIGTFRDDHDVRMKVVGSRDNVDPLRAFVMKCLIAVFVLTMNLGGFSLLPCCDVLSVLAAAPPQSLILVDEKGVEHAVTAADLAKLPRVKAKVVGHDGQAAEYEGARLSDLLEAQGVVLGKELKGPRVANYLLFEADDGYRVTLAIAEVDPATTDKLVLLADRKNGAALPEKEGPLRLVLPDDKRPVRWIRMLKRISIQAPPARAATAPG